MSKNMYEILEVSQSASGETINAASTALIAKYSLLADAGNEYGANQVKVLNSAYGVLSSPDKRRLYDARLAATKLQRENRAAQLRTERSLTQPDELQDDVPPVSRWFPEFEIALPIGKQPLALIGSLLLLVGVFAPIIKIPILGSLNYFQNGRGDGAIVLVLSVTSIYFALTNRYRPLWITGLLSAAVLLFTFVRFQWVLSEAKGALDRNIAGSPFAGVATAAFQGVQLEWGWILLVIGAGMIVLAAVAKPPSD